MTSQRSLAPDPQRVADPARWSDPSQPVLTFYDDATGERVEFSARTLANWVAKTANLGVDVLDLKPGDSVAIDLPVHWLGVVWALAAMTAGWRVTPVGSSPDAAAAAEVLVAAVVPDHAFESYRDVVAVSTRPLSLSYGPGLATGVLDYAAEIPANADVFPAQAAPGGFAEPAWSAALALVAENGSIGPGDRVMTGLAPTSTTGLVHVVLGPAIVTASVVLVAGLDDLPPGRADAIATAERVTRRIR